MNCQELINFTYIIFNVNHFYRFTANKTLKKNKNVLMNILKFKEKIIIR